MPVIRVHLPTALRHEDIRHACTAVDHIMGAADILDRLPPPALEAIRDYCSDFTKNPGTFSDFKRAWVAMVIEHLGDAQLRERRLFTGITGQDVTPSTSS